MRSVYIFSLLVLGLVIYFTPAVAQTQLPKTKTTVKPVKKQAPNAKQTTAAKKLGDVAAKSAARDTIKKGGQAKPTDTKNGGSLSEEIIVTTSYKPVLADAVKIRRNPDLEDNTGYKAPLTYTVIDKRLEQNTDIKQLEAAKLPPQRDSVLNNNAVKIGAGNLKTTFAEAYVGNGKDQALQVGAWVKHLGQSGNDAYKQTQSRQEAGVFGKSINEANTISGSITYNRESNYYYGAPSFFSPLTNPLSQHYNTIGAEAQLAKNFVDSNRVFDYALKAKGYLFSNAFNTTENDITITGFINQTVKQFYAGMASTLDLSTQKDNAYNINNSLWRINPYLKFQGDNYKIDAGVNIVTEFGYKSRVSVFPAAKAELLVVPSYLRLFLEAKGDVNKASIKDWAAINPFIGQNLNILNSVDRLDLTAGFKGTILPGLAFTANIFRKEVTDMPLFTSDLTAGYNQFNITYDKITVSGFKGELDYKASDDFDLFGKAEFKDYKTTGQAQAWNLPKFVLTAGTVIHISNKIDLSGSLLIRGATNDIVTLPGAVLTTSTAVNKSFADVSAGATYKADKRFSVFVHANNLLNTNYSEWLYYRNYGFNIFGGVGFGF